MRIAIPTFLFAAALAASPALGEEPSEEMRQGASIIARVEALLAKDDLKGFCAAVHKSPAYAGYASRACQAGVKANVRQAEECTEARIALQVAADHEECVAMPPEAFAQRKQDFGEGRARFLQDLAARGVDGEKLIAEERAKLR